jgi:hypothetical protein
VVPHLDLTLLMIESIDVEHVELQYSPRKVLLSGTSLMSSAGSMNRGPQVTSVDNAALHAAGICDGSAPGLGYILMQVTKLDNDPKK